MEKIISIANKYRLPIIEDAAQSIGAEYSGKRAGTFGLIGCYSFFPSKNLGGLGDSGLVVTNDNEMFEIIKKLRIHGACPKYYHSTIGGNFRMDTIQAAFLKEKLPFLDEYTAKRQKNAQQYRQLFTEKAKKITQMSSVPELPAVSANTSRHVYNQFTIKVKGRNGLRSHLNAYGIGHEVYYPLPLHLQQCFLPLGYKNGDFVNGEGCSETVLSLPIFEGLSSNEIEYVVEKVMEFYEKD
ncbi:MAG: DegT/DnrJ/EryC1/StrS family aminotransferase [Oligoflexia bacterium]|nr:DegT/DnrJ/EryC1/StrS family aminotransferase [Oligoflexia bacterium]